MCTMASSRFCCCNTRIIHLDFIVLLLLLQQLLVVLLAEFSTFVSEYDTWLLQFVVLFGSCLLYTIYQTWCFKAAKKIYQQAAGSLTVQG